MIACLLALFSCCGTKKNLVTPAFSIPVCLQQQMQAWEASPAENTGRMLYEYTYKGKTVYYVKAPCCDQFNDLLDENCTVLGHPDGGFTGRGDGRFPGFKDSVGEGKLLWKAGK